MTSGTIYRHLTNVIEAEPQGVDWIKLAQKRSWWLTFVDTVMNDGVLLISVEILDQLVDYWLLERIIFDMRQPSGCCGWGGANIAHFCSPPSCLCDLHTACWVRE